MTIHLNDYPKAPCGRYTHSIQATTDSSQVTCRQCREALGLAAPGGGANGHANSSLNSRGAPTRQGPA